MLRHLSPASGPIDVLDMVLAEERSTDAPPWVMYNMVASVDGATAVAGGSTALNDEDDKALFAALRVVPDVVLAGAETIRAENYGPVRLDEQRRRRRVENGKDAVPRLAIATRSLRLDPELRVFGDPEYRPLVVTGEDAPEDRVAALSGLADIVQLPELDPESILGALGDPGIVLCEGGPSLNGQLIAGGFIDEMNLTISPLVAVGESYRVAHGDDLGSPVAMRLDRVLTGDRSLFLRYLRVHS